MNKKESWHGNQILSNRNYSRMNRNGEKKNVTSKERKDDKYRIMNMKIILFSLRSYKN